MRRMSLIFIRMVGIGWRVIPRTERRGADSRRIDPVVRLT